jgi:hypothetical protein
MNVGETIRCTAEIPVVDAADVLVVGGGTAGCLAALAAARNGASVILVERYGHLGGMMTFGNAALTMYMKFSARPEDHDKDQESLRDRPEDVQIVGGIVKELSDRLIASGTGIGNYHQAGSYIFTSSEDFKRLLFDVLTDAGVTLRLHSWAVDAVKVDSAVSAVVVESKSGRQALAAKMVIDATGDGDVCVKAGVPYALGVTADDLCAKAGAKLGEMQAMGVMFKVGNVDLQVTFDWLESNPERFRLQGAARFPLEEARAHFERGDMATFNLQVENGPPPSFQIYNLPTKGVVTLCCPCFRGDGTSVNDLTRAEVVMADMVHRWLGNISAEIPGFRHAFLLDCPQIGVRETRHIRGEHVLNIEEVYHQADFPDSIGMGAHPIDTQPRPDWLKGHTAYPPRWFFRIPFRSLIAKGVDNLMVVGRCMSATHEAFGCIRPTVQCMITGEAAGTAAALCVRDRYANVRDLPAEALRSALQAQGVVL